MIVELIYIFLLTTKDYKPITSELFRQHLVCVLKDSNSSCLSFHTCWDFQSGFYGHCTSTVMSVCTLANASYIHFLSSNRLSHQVYGSYFFLFTCFCISELHGYAEGWHQKSVFFSQWSDIVFISVGMLLLMQLHFPLHSKRVCI